MISGANEAGNKQASSPTPSSNHFSMLSQFRPWRLQNSPQVSLRRPGQRLLTLSISCLIDTHTPTSSTDSELLLSLHLSFPYPAAGEIFCQPVSPQRALHPSPSVFPDTAVVSSTFPSHLCLLSVPRVLQWAVCVHVCVRVCFFLV